VLGCRRGRGWGLGIWGLGFLLLSCACAPPTPAPTPAPLTVVASDLAAPLLSDLAAAYAGERPDRPLYLEVMAAASLPEALTSGRAALAFTADPQAGAFATPIGSVRFRLVVHPANLVNALTLAQAQALFAGRATDWAEVGGAPGAVQVVTRERGADGAGALAVVASELTPNALIAPGWDAMRALVAETPGALGYLPESDLAGLKAVSLDIELSALIMAVASAEPIGPARDFLAWVQSEAGQAVVAQRHERLD